MTRSTGRRPTHIALTRQLSAYASSNTTSPPTVGDPRGIPVVADPADRAREVPVVGAEAQAVEERDGSGAHRDDVAENPADAGGGALEGLDRGRVIVALDLERDGEAVAEVEHARVLTRALEHARALARQPPQEQRRVLVAAMLRPEQGKDRELEVVRLPSEQGDDTVELLVREAERAVDRLCHGGAQVTIVAAGPGRDYLAPRRVV